ncbi:MAG: MFS transporter, partial [Firmicutes bacterium]|nr:MFS transporter [Bacillota bacterium]
MTSKSRNWYLFLLGSALLGLTVGLHDPSFNNYLSEVHHVSPTIRGLLEFPREGPGCVIALLSGALAFLPDTRVASLAVVVWGLGLLGMALFSPTLGAMVVWMIAVSVGSHVYLPLTQSLGVAVSGNERVGRRLGQLAGATTAATILGAAFVWFGTRFLGVGYSVIFTAAAGFAFLGALCFLPMRVAPAPRAAASPRRVASKRQYRLFYLLNILFGARKQVFLTFGPWVIVRVFGQPASTIAMLWMISSFLGIGFRPVLGRLVDTLGERKVLMGEAALLILICLGYALGANVTLAGVVLGLPIIYACFVLDHMLAAVTIARTSYLWKIAEDPTDMTPALSLGISLDHVVAMAVPALGGLAWTRWGYEYVFLAAAVFAGVNLFAASRIRVPHDRSACGLPSSETAKLAEPAPTGVGS